MESKLNAFKDQIKSGGFEEMFLKSAGISSLDELHPGNVEESAIPVVHKGQTVVSAEARPHKPLQKSDADAPERPSPSVASDILTPFVGIHISYPPRKKPSSYTPSCLMMDYIVHLINHHLSDNFYAKRDIPDFHPYILRLYYGILFWIQCLRAGHDVKRLTTEQHQFLTRFLSWHPLESLPIASPLIPLFKTLCSSQPEITTYGPVYPALPDSPGPASRSLFMLDDPAIKTLPNIPGIFALIADLDSKVNAGTTSVYPSKGKHEPVTATATQATVFGHYSFPPPNERTDAQKWMLCSPGLQYPCEADKKHNTDFAERISYFDFPVTAAGDNIMYYENYFSFNASTAWFSQVKAVAQGTAAYFVNPGTLADCSPSGIPSNQIVVEYQDPIDLPAAPTKVADKASLFPFAFKLSTSCRSLPPLSEAMASMAQTNIRMFPLHPNLAGFNARAHEGDFWDIRPTETSSTDDSSYLSLNEYIKKMMRNKL